MDSEKSDLIEVECNDGYAYERKGKRVNERGQLMGIELQLDRSKFGDSIDPRVTIDNVSVLYISLL